jgi:hypothetical protein
MTRRETEIFAARIVVFIHQWKLLIDATEAINKTGVESHAIILLSLLRV